jgi:hypothetical protein
MAIADQNIEIIPQPINAMVKGSLFCLLMAVDDRMSFVDFSTKS